jgi:hypothetical protein
MKRKNLIYTLAALSALFILSLACRQSGEIITPAEATQRYEATQAAQTGDVVVVADGAVFQPGDKAVLASEGYLVGMYQEPGGRTPFSYATRGDEVTVGSSVDVDGVIWYEVRSVAGMGWLPASNFEIEEEG